jgi:hypothetical protein
LFHFKLSTHCTATSAAPASEFSAARHGRRACNG